MPIKIIIEYILLIPHTKVTAVTLFYKKSYIL